MSDNRQIDDDALPCSLEDAWERAFNTMTRAPHSQGQAIPTAGRKQPIRQQLQGGCILFNLSAYRRRQADLPSRRAHW